MPRTINVGASSLFVTLTAWVSIALAALVAVLAGVQHAQVTSMVPVWKQAGLPGLSHWLLDELPWVLASAATLSLLLVAAAIGLLVRLDWARRVFIGLAGLAIAVQGLGLWLQHEVVQALLHIGTRSGAMPAAAAGLFGSLATAAQVMGVLVTLALCGLLAWVIGRLMSDPVRQEFA